MDRMHNKRLVPYAKALRKNMTKEERHLWYDYLNLLPIRFYRQKIIGKYIVDFYSSEVKMVIEVDGSQHFEEAGLRCDAERDAYLRSYGLDIIRIPNNEINNNFNGVCEYLDNTIQQRKAAMHSLPCVKGGGTPQA